jgi:hypothetical protein
LETAGGGSKSGQDVRDGSVYVYQEPITLAVRVALATGRPLLLLGPPVRGCTEGYVLLSAGEGAGTKLYKTACIYLSLEPFQKGRRRNSMG